MKKIRKLALVIVVVLVLATLLAGCNYINVLLNRFKQNEEGDPITLGVTTVRLEGTVLSWDSVENATAYEVRYVDEQGTAKTVVATQCTYDAAQLQLTVGLYRLSVRAKRDDLVGAYSNECILSIKKPTDITVTPVVYYIDEHTLAVQCDQQEGAANYCVVYGDATLRSSAPFVVVENADTTADIDFVFYIEGDATHDFGTATRTVTYTAAQPQPIAECDFDKGSGQDLTMDLWLVSDVQLDGAAIDYKGHTTLRIEAGALAAYGYGKHFLEVTYATGVWRGLLLIWDSRALQPVNTKGEALTQVDYRLARSDLNIYCKMYDNTVTSLTVDDDTWAKGTQYTVTESGVVLAKAAMATLAEGDHTVTIRYCGVRPDGASAEGSASVTVHCVSVVGLVYNKATGGVLECDGLPLATKAILGGDIASNQYLLSRQDSMATAILAESYLAGLAAGTYTYVAVTGNTATDESFDIEVYDSTCTPTAVYLDYDTDASIAYVRFACDCGANAHRFTLDDTSRNTDLYAVPLTGLSRNAKHTLSVTCLTNNTTGATFTIDGRDSKSHPYIGRHFDFEDTSPDYFIANQREFNWFLRYLAYGGEYDATYGSNGISQAEVYIGAGVLSESYTLNELVTNALDSFAALAAGAGGVGDPSVSGGSIKLNPDYSCVLNVYYVFNAPIIKTATTGMSPRATSDPRDLLSTYTHTPYIARQDVGITTMTVSNLIQLAAVPYGVRPVFEGDSVAVQHARAAYNAALEVCRTYIGDDMTDYEKVEALYNYLCTNVTYDDYALAWYMLDNYAKILLQNEGSSDSSLAKLRERIDIYKDNSRYAGMGAMLDELSALGFGEALAYLNAKMANTAFDMYGALVDKVAVCDGISEAMRLLCWMENIPCLKVTGYVQNSNSDGENHAWNKVQIDGEWYVVDATWGRWTDTDHTFDVVTHQYCMVPDSKVYTNHFENGNNVADARISTVATAGQYDYYAMTVQYGKDMAVVDWNDFSDTLKELHKHNDIGFVELRFDFAVTEHDVETHCTAMALGFGLSYSYSNGYILVWFK